MPAVPVAAPAGGRSAPPPGPGQRGFTLIELLITLVLSSVLAIGLLNIMSSNTQNFHMANSQTQLLDDGQYLIDTLSREVRRAGYKSSPDLDPSQPDAAGLRLYVFEPEPAGASLVSGANLPNIAKFAQDEYIKGGSDNGGGLDGTPDSLMIRYQVEDQNDLDRTTCGRGLNFRPLNANDEVWDEPYTNVLYVGFYVSNQGILYCTAKIKGPDSNNSHIYEEKEYQYLERPVPLVGNVQNFRVLYGIDTDGADKSANQYLNAAQVTNLGLWQKVISARIVLVLRSAETQIAVLPTQSYKVNGKDVALSAEAQQEMRLYQTFSTTVVIRNKVQ